ncbi:RecF/RecN/SMC protein [Cladochytrium replicatum]|nr:RecF/RecN/SMC protein [Cladochytrium replicatum]
MHIHQITIHGFKSYKDQTVIEPFSPKHNVVVGRNGSGKSNFFWAIRFVLGDAYSSMTRETRQSLLHEGTGPATLSAYVEVTFDNSDLRFPTGKEEVILRRTIGLKKDEYSLDKKSITKSEVVNLLESAGFSRANPYYIVPQGRITKLTNDKDSDRLELLKDVAGTKVYEERRGESLKIMEDTEMKRQSIDDLLESVNERIETLESEKQELKEFQELDRDRRCLEYSIFLKEQVEVNEQLEELEEQHRAEIDGSSRLQLSISEREELINQHEMDMRDLHQQTEINLIEKNSLENDIDALVRSKTILELTLNDMRSEQSGNVIERRKLVGERETLDKQIADSTQKLEELRPQFEGIAQKDTRCREELLQSEEELSALKEKQGRSAYFRTKSDRDQWLDKEISDLEGALTATEGEIRDLTSKVDETKTQLENATADQQKCAEDRTTLNSRLQGSERQFIQLRSQRTQLEEQRKTLWREDAKHSTSMDPLRTEAKTAERTFFSMMDRATTSGLKALKRVTSQLRLEQYVYGPLFELFDLDPVFYKAVEVIVGNSLFHVVVEDDTVASKLIEIMTREHCGRLTFMPLTRLKHKETEMPKSDDAVPMLEHLSYSEKYEKAFLQVFGKAIICPNLEVASAYARLNQLNAVTMDGDRADRKGALTGGFVDTKKSRLEAAVAYKNSVSKLAQAEARANEIKIETELVGQELTKCKDQLEQLESKRRSVQTQMEHLSVKVSSCSAQVSQLAKVLAQQNESLAALQQQLKSQQSRLALYRAERKMPLSNTLSPEEFKRLDELTETVASLKDTSVQARGQRIHLESKIKQIEIELNTKLQRRLDDVITKLNSSSDDGSNGGGLADKEGELHSIEKQLREAQKKLEDCDTKLLEISRALEERSQALEQASAAKMQDFQQIERQQRHLEKYSSKKAVLLKRKEECNRMIRELGVLPEEAFEKYRNIQSRQLEKMLRKVNEGLKKYGHVNKKAYEQYNNFTKQRDALLRRKTELDKASKAIADLVKSLDQRKDEAIQRTFKQVAKNFMQVWEKLVPNGRGELIMLRRVDGDLADDDNEDEASNEGSMIDNYTGVAISVSFNSKTDEGLRMPQLSGGQKSLVALALIFAIQQCDPAPFYLFDEIDAALDAQYRTAVANMIHELSENAQFITTTFRPELLVHANKFYGVTFSNKVSKIQVISADECLKFIQDEQPQ